MRITRGNTAEELQTPSHTSSPSLLYTRLHWTFLQTVQITQKKKKNSKSESRKTAIVSSDALNGAGLQDWGE